MTEMVRLSLEDAEALCMEALLANGCDERNARAVTRVVMAAERDACASHGLFRVPGYVASLKDGRVNGVAEPRLEQVAPSVLRVDGDNGFAPLALDTGRDALIETGRAQGLAALSLVKVFHFAALWCDVEPVCDAGLAGFAFTAYMPCVVPTGGSEPLFGTNPMAFGWPRPGGQPVIYDQAAAAMARGDIMIAARDGHEVPPGVGVDPSGRDTTDPKEILKGAQRAFGGYKGANIALMVELLVGALIGERFSYEAAEHDEIDSGPVRGGELLLALDPDRFGDAAGWADHAEGLFSRMAGMEGVRLPGARRYENRRRTAQDGVAIPATLHGAIQQCIVSSEG